MKLKWIIALIIIAILVIPYTAHTDNMHPCNNGTFQNQKWIEAWGYRYLSHSNCFYWGFLITLAPKLNPTNYGIDFSWATHDGYKFVIWDYTQYDPEQMRWRYTPLFELKW